MTIIIINSCDKFKQLSSFKVIGAYTNRQYVDKLLRTLIKQDIIEYNGTSVVRDSIDELNNKCTYIHLNEIVVNEKL
jgi:hypothetical protein